MVQVPYEPYVTTEDRIDLLDLRVKRLVYRWWLLLSGVAIGFLAVLCAVLVCFQVLEQRQAKFERQLKIEIEVFKAMTTDLTDAQTKLILNINETINVLDQLEELKKEKVYELNRGRDIGPAASGSDSTGG